jgi:hypothetical protein
MVSVRRAFMGVCPHTQSYVIYGIYQGFENATQALEAGNSTLANFYLEKIIQKLHSLSGTRLMSEENARAIAAEFMEQIRDQKLNFSESTINALVDVTS